MSYLYYNLCIEIKKMLSQKYSHNLPFSEIWWHAEAAFYVAKPITNQEIFNKIMCVWQNCQLRVS